jgi:N-acyl-D-aspartate/D-glutamate deacylase
MTFDLVIRGGRVIDGTGMPGYQADVAIQEGRIARIGRVTESAKRVIDADGAIVTPGFIDVHTHYDVQLDWDPIASPSCYHGVTTVLTGNCGFTLAPARPEDVPWLAAMLSRVEGMSKEALAVGFKFYGGSFADFWNRHVGKLGVNAGGYVGHSAVRRYVMGDDASNRERRPTRSPRCRSSCGSRCARARSASPPRRSTSTSATTAARCRPTTRRPKR